MLNFPPIDDGRIVKRCIDGGTQLMISAEPGDMVACGNCGVDTLVVEVPICPDDPTDHNTMRVLAEHDVDAETLDDIQRTYERRRRDWINERHVEQANDYASTPTLGQVVHFEHEGRTVSGEVRSTATGGGWAHVVIFSRDLGHTHRIDDGITVRVADLVPSGRTHRSA